MEPETWVTLGVMLMGLGVLVAGSLGVSLPEGQRLGALFALIVGAGVGLVVLGIGSLLSDEHEPSEMTFFIGALLGFLAVCTAAWVVRKRAIAKPDA
jgi:hypothetical protein